MKKEHSAIVYILIMIILVNIGIPTSDTTKEDIDGALEKLSVLDSGGSLDGDSAATLGNLKAEDIRAYGLTKIPPEAMSYLDESVVEQMTETEASDYFYGVDSKGKLSPSRRLSSQELILLEKMNPMFDADSLGEDPNLLFEQTSGSNPLPDGRMRDVQGVLIKSGQASLEVYDPAHKVELTEDGLKFGAYTIREGEAKTDFEKIQSLKDGIVITTPDGHQLSAAKGTIFDYCLSGTGHLRKENNIVFLEGKEGDLENSIIINANADIVVHEDSAGFFSKPTIHLKESATGKLSIMIDEKTDHVVTYTNGKLSLDYTPTAFIYDESFDFSVMTPTGHMEFDDGYGTFYDNSGTKVALVDGSKGQSEGVPTPQEPPEDNSKKPSSGNSFDEVKDGILNGPETDKSYLDQLGVPEEEQKKYPKDTAWNRFKEMITKVLKK
jgi:hypothetical protein